MSAPPPTHTPAPGEIPGLRPQDTLYGYVPTLWVCGIFIALFALSTLLHIGQAIYYRIWWIFPTIVIGGLCEVLGWSGRLWSSFQPRQLNPYLMQICTTILGPSWLTGANFTILGIIIRRLGSHYSWLSPRLYLIIFLSFDLVALIGQAIGGAKASIAAETGHDPTPGGNLMSYFIIVQMSAITLYCLCAAEFLIRYHFNKPVRKQMFSSPKEEGNPDSPLPPNASNRNKIDLGSKLMLLGMFISTLFIYIRSIYRTIELLNGWSGRIITTQVYFNVLDGAAIVIAIYSINIFHPGYLLKDDAITLGRKPKPAPIDEEKSPEQERTT